MDTGSPVERCIENNNSVLISNMPYRERDEEDLLAMMYVGLAIPIDDIAIKQVERTESKHGRPGNMTVEFCTLNDKIKVLSRKRMLRATNEYADVFIRTVKSNSDIVTERNFATILKSIPGEHNYVMASNGKIIRKHENISINY